MNSLPSSIDPQELGQLVHLLELAQSSDNNKQAEVFSSLKCIEQQSASYIYLAFIFASDTFSINTRKMAGLTMNSFLKRHKNHLHFDATQMSQIKSVLLQVSMHELLNIRSMVISELINKNSFDFELFSSLITGVQVNRENVNMINIILEDIRFNNQNYNIFNDRAFWTVMQLIYENVLAILGQEIGLDLAGNPYIRSYMKCINLLTFHCPNKLYHFISKYLENIIKPVLVASMQGNIPIKILEASLQGLNEIVATKYSLISRQLLDIIIYYNPGSIQLQKCWTNIIIDLVENDENGNFQHLLPVVLPKALNGLQFTSHDERNIKEEMQVQYNPYSDEREELEDEKESETFEASYSGTAGYTLRKLSFQLIEKISVHYSENLWENWFPFIRERMRSEDQTICETAISFIGIIAETCMYDMNEHLEQLMIILLKLASKENCSLIRATSLWTLEKLYPSYNTHDQMVASCLTIIFQGVHVNSAEDTHTTQLMLKQAAVSFLDEILSSETMPAIITLQVLEEIVNSLLVGLHIFKGRALFSIFKAFSSIFQNTFFHTLLPEYTCARIVSELCSKWSHSIKNDSVMCPLLECMITAYEGMKKYLQKFSSDFFLQLHPLLCMSERKQLILRSIDFLSSIISAGLPSLAHLVISPQFLDTILSLSTAQEKEIKHFTYILISDIGKKYNISEYVQRFVLTIAQTMDMKSLTSRNNALMCLTDLLQYYPAIVTPYKEEILGKIVDIIKTEDLQSVYAFNFARMLGRICLIDPQCGKRRILLQPKLVQFAFLSLRTREVSKLTSDAFIGMLNTINSFSIPQLKPIYEDLECVLEALICYPIRREESPQNEATLSSFIQFARILKQKLGDPHWIAILQKPIFLPAALRTLAAWTA